MNNLSPLDLKILKNRNIKLTPEILKRIADGYPIQYIIGDVDFLSYNFIVNESVLIPRFETELLVDKIIKRIKNNNLNIIDICSGSGCIGISLSKILNSKVDCFDISVEANAICKQNMIRNNVKGNVFKLDILNATFNDEYEIIVSNPPYLKRNDAFADNIKFEPDIALYSDYDDIKYYKRIIDIVKNYQKWELIAFEIGEEQANRIKEYAIINNLKKVSIEKDYNQKDRYIFIER